VYCGHEYTAKNLSFAASVEPSNAAVASKALRVAELRNRRLPTVPSTIAEEHETNPFMRCDSAEIRASMAGRVGAGADPIAVLAAVRAAKDAF
jgi:hydroxyacylglutathione hydrolase